MPNGAGNQGTIGVLSLQGSVIEHIRSIEACGVKALPVKTKKALAAVDGLIIPGGESTTIGKLLDTFDLTEPLKKRIGSGLPVWGTCAGLILLAKHIEGEAPRLGVMDMTVRRNAYGTQLDSFSTSQIIPAVDIAPLPLVFIRAPYIISVGEDADVLAEVDGHIVAARQGYQLLATAFHPEVTDDLRFHRYFIEKFCKIKTSR